MPSIDPNKYKLNKMYDFFLLFMGLCSLVLCVTLLLLILLDPFGVVFVGFGLPSGPIWTPIKHILKLIHFYGAVMISTSILSILGGVSFYGVYVTIFYINELKLGRPNQKYKTLPILRNNATHLRHIARAFQVLHCHDLATVGPYTLLIHSLAMLFAIYASFVLLIYWNELELYAKVPVTLGDFLAFVVWSTVIEWGRCLLEKGKKVISSWKKGNWRGELEAKVMKRFAKSSKPLMLSYGSQFVIRNATLFNFYRGVLKGTVRALLMTK